MKWSEAKKTILDKQPNLELSEEEKEHIEKRLEIGLELSARNLRQLLAKYEEKK